MDISIFHLMALVTLIVSNCSHRETDISPLLQGVTMAIIDMTFNFSRI
jgi:hypothetical protein